MLGEEVESRGPVGFVGRGRGKVEGEEGVVYRWDGVVWLGRRSLP